MTYNTGNAVPSDDPRDLDDNAKVLDLFCNSTEPTEPDRFGVERKTLAAIQALYGLNSTALDALTGAADRMPYFTGPGAMSLAVLTSQARQLLDDTSFSAMLVTLGAAARGANSDITSLAGLSTALSVGQGGTGVTTVAAFLAALVTAGAYSKTSILGAVSQASGVPTGAVFEAGGTAAGTGAYIKYADGTLIITKIMSVAAGAVTAMGAIFGNNPTAAGSFPVTFVGEAPRVQHSGTDNLGGGWSVCNVFPTASTWGSYSVRNHVSSGASSQIYLQAVGRWF
jgi:hypothetical protein